MSPAPAGLRGLLYVAVGLVTLAVYRDRRWNSVQSSLRLAVASVGVLGLPTVMTGWAGRHVSGVVGTVVFAMVPVVTVLWVAHGSEDGECARRFLAPGILGMGGILLLVPLEMPGSIVGRWAFAVLIVAAVLVAASGVWMHELLRDFEPRQAVVIVCVSNAFVLFCAGAFDEVFGWSWRGLSGERWMACGWSAAQVLLLIWLLRTMQPLRFAGRFLLIPMLTIVEGCLVIRPGLNFRMWGGMVILAVGTSWILFARHGEEASSLSLL